METADRIRKFQIFAGKWLQATSLFGILLLLTAGWNWYFTWPVIPDALANMLWISLTGFTWALIDLARLRQDSYPGTFREKLTNLRRNLKIRRTVWGILFVVGLCLAVFTAIFSKHEAFLFAGIGLCLPAGIFFLAELGLGLQADWIWHTLNRNDANNDLSQ